MLVKDRGIHEVPEQNADAVVKEFDITEEAQSEKVAVTYRLTAAAVAAIERAAAERGTTKSAVVEQAVMDALA